MRRLPLLALLALTALPVNAQDLATLQADRVMVTGDSVLQAEGGVEMRYRGQIVRAKAVTYDRDADHLSITGPLTVVDAKGNIVTADTAELSTDLSEGLLTSARLVLDRQMQIAARQMFRTQGRYTELTDTVASSCQVCTVAPTPLWEVRASRVVHDQVAQQLWFDDAQLRFVGVPVAWLPRLRLPDPTLQRARGFLAPDFRNNTQLGAGISLPYFIPLGPSRDITLAPFLSTKNGRTLDLRYREAFQSGWIELNGALSYDEILPDEQRGYLQAMGEFRLPDDFLLAFNVI